MKKLLIVITVLMFCLSTSYADSVIAGGEYSYPIHKIQYDIDGTIEYFGWALPGATTSTAVWKIMRISYTGDDFVIEWSGGTQNYAYEWDERAGTVAYS